eukprot:2688435-Amphidinium_carterae.1
MYQKRKAPSPEGPRDDHAGVVDTDRRKRKAQRSAAALLLGSGLQSGPSWAKVVHDIAEADGP